MAFSNGQGANDGNVSRSSSTAGIDSKRAKADDILAQNPQAAVKVANAAAVEYGKIDPSQFAIAPDGTLISLTGDHEYFITAGQSCLHVLFSRRF